MQLASWSFPSLERKFILLDNWIEHETKKITSVVWKAQFDAKEKFVLEREALDLGVHPMNCAYR